MLYNARREVHKILGKGKLDCPFAELKSFKMEINRKDQVDYILYHDINVTA